MRAALLLDDSDDLVISDEVRLDALGPHEVLVEIDACGLCHSDYHYIDRTLNRPRPQILGHEAVGRVVEVGSAVEMHQVGSRVVTCLVQGCGNCKACRRGEPALCHHPLATKRGPGEVPRVARADGSAVGVMGGVGALADRIVIDERGLVGIPDDVPDHLAAILGCAVITGMGAALNVARIRPGETVAVLGCGGVGLNVVQGARISGASRVIAVDLSASKLDVARRVGATDLVDASAGDPVAAVKELTGGEGVDHAFEVVGRPATAAQVFDMARLGGSAYVVGVMPDDAHVSVPALGFRRGKSIVGVFMGGGDPQVDIPKAVEFWRRGLLDLESMVSRTLPLEHVNEGFAALARGEVARAVVTLR